jgi:hypothetical protein
MRISTAIGVGRRRSEFIGVRGHVRELRSTTGVATVVGVD